MIPQPNTPYEQFVRSLSTPQFSEMMRDEVAARRQDDATIIHNVARWQDEMRRRRLNQARRKFFTQFNPVIRPEVKVPLRLARRQMAA